MFRVIRSKFLEQKCLRLFVNLDYSQAEDAGNSKHLEAGFMVNGSRGKKIRSAIQISTKTDLTVTSHRDWALTN